VLEIIGLTDRQKGAVGKFSGGMKRRLNVGLALLHRPQVLILDEPTVGLHYADVQRLLQENLGRIEQAKAPVDDPHGIHQLALDDLLQLTLEKMLINRG
jgi:ABC-type branched-subunit amino acid transport system ATPase component